jgi:hypothetical protein
VLLMGHGSTGRLHGVCWSIVPAMLLRGKCVPFSNRNRHRRRLVQVDGADADRLACMWRLPMRALWNQPRLIHSHVHTHHHLALQRWRVSHCEKLMCDAVRQPHICSGLEAPLGTLTCSVRSAPSPPRNTAVATLGRHIDVTRPFNTRS